MTALVVLIPICAVLLLAVIALLARNPIRVDAAAYDQAVTAARSRRSGSNRRASTTEAA